MVDVLGYILKCRTFKNVEIMNCLKEYDAVYLEEYDVDILLI